MEYKEFTAKLHKIQYDVFGIEEKDCGRHTRANIEDGDKCFLVLNINPNGKANKEKTKDALFESPLVYIPESYDEEMRKQLKGTEYWDVYKHPYGLFDSKNIKMFWATDEKYKEQNNENHKKLPEGLKEKWVDCFNAEKSKLTKNVLVFSDFFHVCETNQFNVKDKIKELEKQKRFDVIKDIFDVFVNYYRPKAVIVSNAYLRDLLSNCICQYEANIEYYNNGKPKKAIYHEVSILFSPMMWGKGARWFTDDVKTYLKDEINKLL